MTTLLVNGLPRLPDFSHLGLAQRESELKGLVLETRPVTVAEGQRIREVVHRCAHFELVLIAWGAGASTLVHDHGGSECSYLVLQGEIEERLYFPRTTQLQARRSTGAGMTTSMLDSKFSHSMHARGPALSLHVYTKPLGIFSQFDPATMGWSSVDGAKL